jgi:predicted enzyme related to lactoylglutathione lyase
MPKVFVTQINVSDMDKAIDFYCNKIGFEVYAKEYYPQIVQLSHEGIPLILNKVAKSTNIDYPNDAQTLIYIQTDNLEASLKDLKSKGVELIHDSPQDCPVGVYAAFKDPFGNVHELVEFRSKRDIT